MSKSYLNYWIQTYSGKKFYPYNPQIEMIDIQDIAHSLSMLCRFTGHCKWHYSVAQHSVIMANKMLIDGYSSRWALYALLHDGSEAFMGDLNTPTKSCLPEYRRMEDKIQDIIWQAFDLSIPSDEEYRTHVKLYDNIMFVNEARQLMPDISEYDLPRVPDMKIDIPQISPQQAEFYFLELYDKLKSERLLK